MAQRLIIKHRRNRYLFCDRPFSSDPSTAGNSGTGGASLYVTSGPAGSPPPAIEFRRHRLLRPGQHILALGTVVTGNKTSRVATVTEPTSEFAFAMALNTAYRVQVRTWRDDQAIPAINFEQTFDTDGSIDIAGSIRGAGYLLSASACQGGGARFDFVWNNTLEAGSQPTEFALQVQSGPTSPAEVTTPFSASKRRYRLEVAGLTDAGAYVFNIVARNGATTQTLDNASGSGDPAIAITADASGPSAVSLITTEER
jgi:hypothetical protein